MAQARVTKDDIDERVQLLNDGKWQRDRVLKNDDFLPIIRADEQVADKDLRGVQMSATGFDAETGDTPAVYFDLRHVDLSDHKISEAKLGHVEIGEAARADFSNSEIEQIRLTGDAKQALFIGTKAEKIYIDDGADVRDAVMIGLETKHWGEMQSKAKGVAITTPEELESKIDRFPSEQVQQMLEAFGEAKARTEAVIAAMEPEKETDFAGTREHKRRARLTETDKLDAYEAAIKTCETALVPDGMGNAAATAVRSLPVDRELRK